MTCFEPRDASTLAIGQPLTAKHAEKLALGPCRIRQRTQQAEYGPDLSSCAGQLRFIAP